MSTSFGWEAKAGMVHSVSRWTRGVQVKLWDPLRTCAIPERFRGVIMTRRYTNSRLPLPLPQHWTDLALLQLRCVSTISVKQRGGTLDFRRGLILWLWVRFPLKWQTECKLRTQNIRSNNMTWIAPADQILSPQTKPLTNLQAEAIPVYS